MENTIAPVVEFTATDGTIIKLCFSFAEIRRAEAQVPGANIVRGLLASEWNCADTLAAFLGSARKLQPGLTVADVEAMIDGPGKLLEMIGATMASWDKSRSNPSNPASAPEPAGSVNP
jgi:hypothetical protein